MVMATAAPTPVAAEPVVLPSASADALVASLEVTDSRPVVVTSSALSMKALVCPSTSVMATAPAMVTAPSLVSALYWLRLLLVWDAPEASAAPPEVAVAEVRISSFLFAATEMLPAETCARSESDASVSPRTTATATLAPAAVAPPAVPSATVVTVLKFSALRLSAPPTSKRVSPVTRTMAELSTREVATAASAATDPEDEARDTAEVVTTEDAVIDTSPVLMIVVFPFRRTRASDETSMIATSTGRFRTMSAVAVTWAPAVIVIVWAVRVAPSMVIDAWASPVTLLSTATASSSMEPEVAVRDAPELISIHSDSNRSG
jgi:hypothetical protein